MIISQYIIGFVIFSFLGWVWESIYCMCNTGTFENRGFLFGPCCPIYGSSIMIAYFIFTSGKMPVSVDSTPLVIFLICMFGSAIMEYLTSYVLEVLYHARWWDYSNLPFNINGRIALPISVAFGVAGIAVVKYIIPVFSRVMSHESLCFELVALILVFVMGTDLGLTLASLSEIVSKINDIEAEFGDKVQFAYDRIGDSKQELQEQVSTYSEYVKMRVSDAASHLSRRDVEMMSKVHFTKPNVSYISGKLVGIVKGRKNEKE